MHPNRLARYVIELHCYRPTQANPNAKNAMLKNTIFLACMKRKIETGVSKMNGNNQ